MVDLATLTVVVVVKKETTSSPVVLDQVSQESALGSGDVLFELFSATLLYIKLFYRK